MKTMLNKNYASVLAWLAIAVSLVGCAKKPPGCADPETVQTILSIAVSNSQALMPQTTNNPGRYEDDPSKILERYFGGLKAELVNVRTDGYNEQAKKYACQGNLTLTTLSGSKFSRDIAYSTQRTEDKESKFWVEVAAFKPFINSVATDASMHYAIKRYVGEWKGDYICGGIEGAKDGPQGPFSMPVAMVVGQDMRAKLERTTKGGGVETLAGEAGHFIKLGGEGKNSPDDTWRTFFEGPVKGMDFTAAGEIFTEDKRLLRTCTLKLKLPTN